MEGVWIGADVVGGRRVDEGLRRLAQSLDEFVGKDERIPKLLVELDF